MSSTFSKNIAPFVLAELAKAEKARANGDISSEFTHYENAHVLGQESTFWHVRVHFLMLKWGMRNLRLKEVLGQSFRIIGAATKTAIGLVPMGNTGGTNVSPFKKMPVRPEFQKIISNAKVDV